MFPRNFSRVTVVIGLVAACILAVAPTAEATTVAEAPATVDEPRHTQTVKAHGPYRLNIKLPKTSKATATIVTRAPEPKPPTPKPEPSPQPASGGMETVIAFAMAQLGDPYVWGGNGPNGWDCSGLVHAAFSSAGITITRTTRTLIHEGSPVGRSALARGDLVFPNAGHVGIYLGGGEMIHAPQPGDVVKISPIWSFYAARRI